MRILLAGMLVLSALLLSGLPDTATVLATEPIPCSADRGAQVFNQCKTCHSYKEGDPHFVGPNLYGVTGRKAGSVDKFVFSGALRDSGITWTDEAIDRFLANPQSAVPGTRMAFGGVRQTSDRADLICYLHSMKSVNQPKG